MKRSSSFNLIPVNKPKRDYTGPSEVKLPPGVVVSESAIHIVNPQIPDAFARKFLKGRALQRG